MTRTRSRAVLGAAAVLLALVALGAPPAIAQPSTRAVAPLLRPLSADERKVILTRVAADPRLRELVGEAPTRTIVGEPILEKAELERYLTQVDAPAPTRRFSVVVFDAKSNRAARAYVAADGSIARAEAIPAGDVPFTGEDVRDALAIARTNDAVRRRVPNLDRFTPQTPGVRAARDAFVAQLLPLRGTDPNDPCTRDRCADLIFRTPTGYLSVRAHVDLTRRSADVNGGPR